MTATHRLSDRTRINAAGRMDVAKLVFELWKFFPIFLLRKARVKLEDRPVRTPELERPQMQQKITELALSETANHDSAFRRGRREGGHRACFGLTCPAAGKLLAQRSSRRKRRQGTEGPQHSELHLLKAVIGDDRSQGDTQRPRE